MILANRLAATAATLAAIAVTVTACGTTKVDEPAAGGAATPSSQTCADDATKTSTGPVSLIDGVGRKVELAKPAQRVAVMEWQQTEDVLTLCLTPVAVADTKGYGTYVKAEPLPAGVVNTGERGEPDLDALYATNPDLIIVEAFKADDEQIAKLEKRGVRCSPPSGRTPPARSRT